MGMVGFNSCKSGFVFAVVVEWCVCVFFFTLILSPVMTPSALPFSTVIIVIFVANPLLLSLCVKDDLQEQIESSHSSYLSHFGYMEHRSSPDAYLISSFACLHKHICYILQYSCRKHLFFLCVLSFFLFSQIRATGPAKNYSFHLLLPHD